jgi:hypothetical protein
MQDKVDKAKHNAGVELKKITPFAIDSSARVMSIFLNRSFQHKSLGKNDYVEMQRISLQREVSVLHREWESRWKAGSPNELGEDDRLWASEKGFPEEFPTMDAIRRQQEAEADEGDGSLCESESEQEDTSEEE